MSKRKIYLAIVLIVILAVCGVGGFLAYRYFASPKLSIESFTVKNEPLLSWYHSASDWQIHNDLNYKFINQGGAANSVKVVVALYDSRGLVVNYTKEYGKVGSNMEITDSNSISVFSSMNIVSPASFKVFLYEGDTLADEATLPYS